MPLLMILALFSAPVAHAQSAKTLSKASRFIGPDQDSERIRRGFQMLSDAIRAAPEQATPAGLWLQADAAALLAIRDDNSLASATIALESYERAAKSPLDDRDLVVYAMLEGFLHERAQAYDNAKTPQERTLALEAAQLYLRADDIRILLDQSKPVERARRYMLAVSCALAAEEVRAARKLFEELDAMGGFIEPLALRVASAVEEGEGPHQAFVFLKGVVEKHPRRRKLLDAYLQLCAANGWSTDGLAAVDRAVDHYGDGYDEHLRLAGYFEGFDAPDRALEHYRSALRLAPRSFDANWRYASLLARQADANPDPEAARSIRDAARSAIAVVLESNPESTEALELLATLDAGLPEELPAP